MTDGPPGGDNKTLL